MSNSVCVWSWSFPTSSSSILYFDWVQAKVRDYCSCHKRSKKHTAGWLHKGLFLLEVDLEELCLGRQFFNASILVPRLFCTWKNSSSRALRRTCLDTLVMLLSFLELLPTAMSELSSLYVLVGSCYIVSSNVASFFGILFTFLCCNNWSRREEILFIVTFG
jgi:hypothetical protein